MQRLVHHLQGFHKYVPVFLCNSIYLEQFRHCHKQGNCSRLSHHGIQSDAVYWEHSSHLDSQL